MSDEDVHLLLYEYVPDMATRREPVRPAHLEHVKAQRDAGRIAYAGAYDPPAGAALIFKGVEREYVESFVADDPYNQAGLITSWRLERWLMR